MEKVNLNDFWPHLIDDSMTEAKLVRTLKKDWESFTLKRNNIEKYVTSKESVSAYTLFYLTTNLPKLEWLLAQLPQGVVEKMLTLPWVDYAMGPGTYSIALASILGPKKCPKILGIDHSPLMVEQSLKLFKALYPTHPFQAQQTPKIESSYTKGVLIMGHGVNEMGLLSTIEVIKKVCPRYIIFIEPGTKESFAQMMELRKILINLGHKIIYPCPTEGSCPMISTDWCHQVMHTAHHSSVERLCQLVSRDRRTMPMIAHVYSFEQGSEERGTLVRQRKSNKHSFLFDVCQEQEGENIYINSEVPKKLFSKQEIKSLEKVDIGVKVSLSLDKIVGERVWRLSKSPFQTKKATQGD